MTLCLLPRRTTLPSPAPAVHSSSSRPPILLLTSTAVNLYKRVNELLTEESAASQRLAEPPLYAWWALLPPPLDVVVGLRQVHFLAKYWAGVRGDEWQEDKVAEYYFPFIAAERFTLRKFFRTPSMWFWFTRDAKDFDFELLKEPEP